MGQEQRKLVLHAYLHRVTALEAYGKAILEEGGGVARTMAMELTRGDTTFIYHSLPTLEAAQQLAGRHLDDVWWHFSPSADVRTYINGLRRHHG